MYEVAWWQKESGDGPEVSGWKGREVRAWAQTDERKGTS